MIPARYAIAFLTAATVVGCGVLFCLHTRRALVDSFRQSALDPANAETVPDDWKQAAERGELPDDVGLEIPDALMWRLSLADWLVGYSIVWILLAFGVSFGVAYYLGAPPETP